MGGRDRDGWKKRGQRNPWEQPGGKPAADRLAERDAEIEAATKVETRVADEIARAAEKLGEAVALRFRHYTTTWESDVSDDAILPQGLTPERLAAMREQIYRSFAGPGFGSIFTGIDMVEKQPKPDGRDRQRAAEREARGPVEKYLLKTKHSTAWDDIVGNEAARQALVEAIEQPVRNRDIYARYGKKAAKGVLLYGPPGNGKTMFGKAAASVLATLHEVRADDGVLLRINGPELKSMWYGAEEAAVRAIFAYARAYKALHGFPLVIFVDEAETVVPSRDGAAGRQLNHVEEGTVATFLTEMDGLEDSGAFVILASNRPHAIDAALLRDGRCDRKIRVGRPDRDAVRIILERALAGVPTGGGVERPALAADAAARVFDPWQRILQLVVQDQQGLRYAFLTLGDVVSGAMAVGLVERAKEAAIRRDIASGTPGGIVPADLEAAIDLVVRESRGVDQTTALIEFAERNSVVIQGVGPIAAAARTIGIEGHEQPVH